VKVIVTDQDGKLKAEEAITVADGTVLDEIHFLNIYKDESSEPNDPGKPDKPVSPDEPNQPDEPDQPEKPNQSGKPEQPEESGDTAQTGDQTNIFFYLTMFFGSGAIILAMYLFVIRKRRDI